MSSHVEQQVQARIAAAKAKTQQQREEREAFSRQRAAGLVARKRRQVRRIYCATCARLQRKGKYRRCPLGCGEALCNTAGCGNTHLRQCANRGDIPTTREAS